MYKFSKFEKILLEFALACFSLMVSLLPPNEKVFIDVPNLVVEFLLQRIASIESSEFSKPGSISHLNVEQYVSPRIGFTRVCIYRTIIKLFN